MTGEMSLKLVLNLSLFSDFEPAGPVRQPVCLPGKTTSAAKKKPLCPKPPVPLSKMPKDVLDKFCRQMLNFCVPKKQTRGRGSLAVWEERLPVSSLSSRTRALLKGDTVALSDIRSWNPGMALGAKFKQGPGPEDKEWRMSMPWMKFLVLVTEVLCLKSGCDPEAGQDLSHEKRCCMPTSLCRVKKIPHMGDTESLDKCE